MNRLICAATALNTRKNDPKLPMMGLTLHWPWLTPTLSRHALVNAQTCTGSAHLVKRVLQVRVRFLDPNSEPAAFGFPVCFGLTSLILFP